MFKSTDGRTVTLNLTTADAAALTGLIQFGGEHGDPLVAMAAQHVGDLMRDAVMEAVPVDQAIAEIDRAMEEARAAEVPEPILDQLAELRETCVARQKAEAEPGSTDMSEFEAAMLRDATDGTEPV